MAAADADEEDSGGRAAGDDIEPLGSLGSM